MRRDIIASQVKKPACTRIATKVNIPATNPSVSQLIYPSASVGVSTPNKISRAPPKRATQWRGNFSLAIAMYANTKMIRVKIKVRYLFQEDEMLLYE